MGYVLTKKERGRDMSQNRIRLLLDNVEKVIIGKRNVAELIVAALLAEGHVLLEDVPGVGKTQLVASIAKSCSGKFNRIQMTPDVMPGDITGFTLINPATKHFEFRKGAAFCNFLLADEINRCSPKSQSALLEIMEENQVSLDGNTFELPKPFMVLATQNPVETFGTFHLPEAQMDRFLMRLTMGYPTKEEELQMLKRGQEAQPKNLSEVISLEEIEALKNQAREIFIDQKVEDYIVDIVRLSRETEGIRLGISPRGTLAMFQAAKAYAFLQGREYVLPDDIKYLATSVWAHRMILSPQGKGKWGSQENCILNLLEQVEVPVV